jgi:DNA polymerase III gamma/tau subunit
MRDAQSNFDQVISFSGEQITAPDVSVALGVAGTDMLVRVINAIAERNAKAALDIVEELISRGHDLRNYARDLMAMFRDLLVFKIGGSSNLIESSILTADEMAKLAEPFSEADFLRAFNSLAETETKLKDATQPRYALEIGLVKLVEMGRVRSVESLLERLSDLTSGETAVSPVRESAAAAPEKKTLISDVRPPAAPEGAASSEVSGNETPRQVADPTVSQPPDEYATEPEEAPWDLSYEPATSQPDTIAPEPEPAAAPQKIDLSFLDSMPVKLPPMDPEELEHVEDTWLDAAYELKLARSGDSLMPLASAADIVKAISPQAAIANGTSAPASNGSGTAAAIAAEFASLVPEPEEIGDTIPAMPADPTEEQLLEYASQHPTVKRALKVFRGKIISVRRT